LAEATDLCRQMVSEFPDNTDYRSRLDTLTKFTTDNFGDALSHDSTGAAQSIAPRLPRPDL
jgi:hypothetical protein